jgi:hypothetical protein
MRGGARHKYWYPGKAGMPSVTIDVHPRTLVIYCDRKQFIPARTPAEALDLGWRSIYQALDTFIEKQSRFAVQIETSHTGIKIGKPHGGFVGSDSPVMAEGVTRPHWWVDRSQESEFGPGHPELETDLPEGMTRLDGLIKLSETMPTALSDIAKSLDPLHQEINALSAHIAGGNTIQYQINQQNTLILKLIEHITNLEKRLEKI